MGLITAAKLLLKGKSMGVIKKIAPTLGLKKTEAYKKSIEKALNKTKENSTCLISIFKIKQNV